MNKKYPIDADKRIMDWIESVYLKEEGVDVDEDDVIFTYYETKLFLDATGRLPKDSNELHDYDDEGLLDWLDGQEAEGN